MYYYANDNSKAYSINNRVLCSAEVPTNYGYFSQCTPSSAQITSWVTGSHGGQVMFTGSAADGSYNRWPTLTGTQIYIESEFRSTDITSRLDAHSLLYNESYKNYQTGYISGNKFSASGTIRYTSTFDISSNPKLKPNTVQIMADTPISGINSNYTATAKIAPEYMSAYALHNPPYAGGYWSGNIDTYLAIDRTGSHSSDRASAKAYFNPNLGTAELWNGHYYQVLVTSTSATLTSIRYDVSVTGDNYLGIQYWISAIYPWVSSQ